MPQISGSHDWLNHNIQLKYLLPLPNPPGSWQYPIPLPPPLRPPYPPYLALLVFHRPEAAPSENDDRKNPDIPVAEVAGEISHPTRENSRVAALAHSLDFHRLPSGAALLLCLSLSLARRSRSLSCCCPARCISLSRPASAQPHPHPSRPPDPTASLTEGVSPKLPSTRFFSTVAHQGYRSYLVRTRPTTSCRLPFVEPQRRDHLPAVVPRMTHRRWAHRPRLA